MRKIILVSIIIMLCSLDTFSQDYIFFDDSPTNVSYDASWGFVNAPSSLEKFGDKFPVDENIKYKGTNSLRLNWKSVTLGNWGIAVAESGWTAHDITSKDSLSFWIYSKSDIISSKLPKLFLEDINNNKTVKQNISDFIDDVVPNKWTSVSIPIQVFLNNSGSADLTKIKTVFYCQGVIDNTPHIIYIDEIRIKSKIETDPIPPAVPQLLFAKGFNKHIDIKWKKNTEDDLEGYFIYKYNGNKSELIKSVNKNEIFFTDFIGEVGVSSSYAISAFDLSGNESERSNIVAAKTREMNDDELLTMLQECTFRYFWDYAHPVSGLTRERLGSENVVTSGGTGMGIMAIVIGIKRGFITRKEGATRLLKMIQFLKNAERFHGVWPHWLNGETGKAVPFSQYDDGGDLVETAFLIQGLLAAREYFKNINSLEDKIRLISTQLWEEVEWDWYRKTTNGSVLFWHWSPNYNWQKNLPIHGFNETMIAYLLAIASPTHSVPANLFYTGWARGNYKNGKIFYDLKLDVGYDYGGPLFFIHYSFLGFDPRNKKDKYTNYFNYARNVSLVHRRYSIANPKGHTGYNAKTWGLTASDDPLVGYTAHSPMNNDNGTITPSAALSSFPYTPNESMEAFRNFYNKYGKKIWGSYGFKDAFNPSLKWFAESYISIDQGPILIMIENYRTNLIWNLFMANPEIKPMLDKIGFVDDITDVEESKIINEYKLYNNYPNPFNPETNIKYSLLETGNVKLEIYNTLGERTTTLVNEVKTSGNHKVVFDGSSLSSGVYFCKMTAGKYSNAKKLMLLK